MTKSSKTIYKYFTVNSAWFELGSWLFNEAYLRNKKESLSIIVISISALFFQLTVFIVPLLYLRNLQHSNSQAVFDISAFNHFGGRTVVVVVIYVFFAILASALLSYYAKIRSLRIRILFEKKCLSWVDAFFEYIPIIGGDSSLQLSNERTYIRLLEKDTRCCGQVVRKLILMLLPLTVVTMSTFGLFYLYPLTTLSLAIFAIIGVVTQLNFARQGLLVSLQKEENKIHQFRFRKIFLKDLFARGCSHMMNPVKSYRDYHLKDIQYEFKKVSNVEKAALITKIISGFILVYIVITLTIQFGKNPGSLPSIIVYVIFLRYCIGHGQRVLQTLGRVSSSLPSLRRMYHVKNTLEIPFSEAEKKGNTSLDYYDLNGELKQLRLGREEPIFVILDGPFDLISFTPILRHIKTQVIGRSTFYSRSKPHFNSTATALIFQKPDDYEGCPAKVLDKTWPHGVYIHVDGRAVNKSLQSLKSNPFSIVLSGDVLYGGGFQDIVARAVDKDKEVLAI